MKTSNELRNDERFAGVPWKDGGRNFAAADCVGLTCLFLELEFGFRAPVPESDTKSGELEPLLAGFKFVESELQRGDVVFFRHGHGQFKGQIRHVAVWLGGGKLLHTFKGGPSRIENGFKLARRVGMEPVAAVPACEAATLARALADKKLGEAVSTTTWVLLAISILLSAASAFLLPSLARNGNKSGKYGFDGLATQNSPEIPLPDILGAVTIAGNSPYTQLVDKNLTVSDATHQAANKIVVLCSGPVYDTGYKDLNILINGLSYNDTSFFSGASVQGVYVNPDQTKAEAVTGSIEGDSNVPSMSIYKGDFVASVPVDIRASYDRTFPIYGYSGCCYLVFRLIDSTKFSSFNLNARVSGRLCRTYDENGFIIGTATSEAVGTGDGTTTRFLLQNLDIVAVSSVTVNGTAYTQIAPGNQTGNVFNLNATKGFIEFITAPGNTLAIVATYTYYTRAWTQCPADHLVYLLTEKGRGKGFDASRIDWQRAAEFQAYCNALVTWTNSHGVTTAPRYTVNYAIDFRKPIQEHMQAILDASGAYLFVSGGKFVMKARAADASVFSFNEGNILKDSFSSQQVDRTDRPNRLKLFYHDQTAYNSETEVDADDAADQASRVSRIGNDGVVDKTLKYPAVDNAPQMERIGASLLADSIHSLWTCSLKTTILGLALEPGDVVGVTHSSRPSWGDKLFRIEDIQHGEDDRLELQLSEYFEAYI